MRLRRTHFVSKHLALSWGYHIASDSPYHIGIYLFGKPMPQLAIVGRIPYRFCMVFYWDKPRLIYGEAGWKEQPGFGMPVRSEPRRTWTGRVKTQWVERVIWRRGAHIHYD